MSDKKNKKTAPNLEITIDGFFKNPVEFTDFVYTEMIGKKEVVVRDELITPRAHKSMSIFFKEVQRDMVNVFLKRFKEDLIKIGLKEDDIENIVERFYNNAMDNKRQKIIDISSISKKGIMEVSKHPMILRAGELFGATATGADPPPDK